MEGDSVAAGSVEVNFENLHGNMNFENNNKETADKIADVKNGENVAKTELSTEDEEQASMETEGGTQKIRFSEQVAEETTENSDDIHSIAKDIIDDVVLRAAEQVKNSVDADSGEASQNRLEPEKSGEVKWLDILGNGRLKKKVITPGGGVDTRPKREQEVTIRYEAKLCDGTVVESEDSFVFVLSDHDVVDAIDLSVSLMERGEKATITTDAKFAYGEEGKPPMIPPNSDLVYEIEILDIQDGPYNVETALEKRLLWADKKREKGNMHYSKKDYAKATETYARCTKVLEQAWMREDEEGSKRMINGLRLKCYNNLAASQMKQEKWKDALKACRAAEKLEPENVKALFRKGKVHVMLGELDRGTQALAKASKLDPDNKIIAGELAKQKRRLEQQKEAQKKMYRRMMGTKDEKEEPAQRSWIPSWSRMVAGTLALGAILLGIYVTQRA